MALERTIKIKVDSKGAEKNVKDLDREIVKTGKNAETSAGQMAGFAKSAAAVAVAATAIGVKLVNVVRKFQTYEGALKTATGSAEKAAIAMEAIQDFASTTPFALDQSIDAFVKLRNLGLDPSEAALRSYGNTAVAMGKDLNQLIEAVADAATGEFERLKEFGIKSKTIGDNVAFTFQGVTTTVGKNAAEIEKFLQDIGNKNFTGAMEEQFNSLNGLISNFGDNVDKVSLHLARQGFATMFSDALVVANEKLADLSDSLESGEFKAAVDAIGSKFEGMGDDVAFTLEFLDKAFISLFKDIPVDAEQSVELISNAFSRMPENIRAFVKIATIEVLALFDGMQAKATFFKSAIDELFDRGTVYQSLDKYKAKLLEIEGVRESTIQNIADERELSLSSTDAKFRESQKLVEQFKAERAARKAAAGDGVLGQFGVEGDGGEAAFNAKLEKQEAEQQIIFDSIAAFEEQKTRLEAEAYADREKSARDAEERRRTVNEISNDIILQNTQATNQDLIGFAEQFAGKSKKLAIAFVALRAAEGISSTIINSQVAATRALAELGPIAGPPAAASMITYGKVSAAIIAANATLSIGKKTSSGGGGSFSSGGGGSIGSTSTRQEPIQANREIDFNGLTEVARLLRDLDPQEVLPVEYTQRIVASLENLERLGG